tara:strand:- start:267 stop:692 length:426 start_codon:yes stop_codon:yes gene_type:complete
MPLVTFSDKVDSKISTVPLVNKIVADDMNQLKNGVNLNETPYVSLIQLISQTGTNAPVAIDVYNNTSQTFTWSYFSTGLYLLTTTGTPFTLNKTVVFLNTGNEQSTEVAATWLCLNTNTIQVFCDVNDRFVKGSFEVKIYS